MGSPSSEWRGKDVFSPWAWCGLDRREPGLGHLEVDPTQEIRGEVYWESDVGYITVRWAWGKAQKHEPEETTYAKEL